MRSIDPGNRWTFDVVMFTATIWSVLGAGTGFCDQNRPAAEQNNAPELPSGLNLNFNIAGGNPVIVVVRCEWSESKWTRSLQKAFLIKHP